ncbi:flavin monoamine oxidase family protein [Biformimicrobium ophioploci]|uniref:Flavin monoamine oxidase family protein n=1 Tax=Biformimicrobium ophioploci TaxID=3036711 RepID=A0ABQ6LXM8_9GAMM|nr:FAD-dependent oxidoreductase [Microbulbifer sp. NKW57]GMG86848.1 flavin monoamine oxidase family protein [Microbulbifer sp. NKW57]
MKKVQVAVIGAGISGLYAARLLQADYSVAVLEARQRVGGRLLNHRFENGDSVDVGGQWVGPGQDRMYRLIESLGMRTFPLYDSGKNLLRLNGRLRPYSGTIPRLNPVVLADIGQLMTRLERMADTLDAAAPWRHPDARKWDAMTLDSWVRKAAWTRQARAIMEIAVGAVFAGDASDFSLLHALFYIRSGHSLQTLLAVTGGAQQDRVHGGTQAVCENMAQSLGSAVLQDTAVQRVTESADGLVIEHARGRVHCERLIIATPPNQTLRIAFEPALPGWRDQLLQRMPAGNVTKCIARYETPFWRDAGLSGQGTGPGEVAQATFDNSEPGKRSGLLMTLLDGGNARRLAAMDAEDRRAAVLQSFANYFGERAQTPLEYVEKDWSADEWARGGYAAHMTTGSWTGNGRLLRSANGRIHWAGTETAREWYGYMEGGLEAAERAAGEVRELLQPNRAKENAHV